MEPKLVVLQLVLLSTLLWSSAAVSIDSHESVLMASTLGKVHDGGLVDQDEATASARLERDNMELGAQMADQFIGGHHEKMHDEGIYTHAPTTAPTHAPTHAPTQRPTAAPSTAAPAPTVRVTQAPQTYRSHEREFVGTVKNEYGVATPSPAPVSTRHVPKGTSLPKGNYTKVKNATVVPGAVVNTTHPSRVAIPTSQYGGAVPGKGSNTKLPAKGVIVAGAPTPAPKRVIPQKPVKGSTKATPKPTKAPTAKPTKTTPKPTQAKSPVPRSTSIKRPSYARPHFSKPQQSHSKLGGTVVADTNRTVKINGSLPEAPGYHAGVSNGTVSLPRPTKALPSVTNPMHLGGGQPGPPKTFSYGGVVHHSHNWTERNSTVTIGGIVLNTAWKHLEYGRALTKKQQAVADSPLTLTCAAFGDVAYYKAGRNAPFTFQGLGEFILFSDAARNEQVNIVLQRYGKISSVEAMAFRSGANTISVALESSSSSTVAVVRFNNHSILATSTKQQLGGFSILQEGDLGSAHRLTVIIKNEGRTKVAVVAYKSKEGLHPHYHLNVFVEAPAVNHFTGGLCATTPAQAWVMPDGNTTTDVVQFATRWSVSHPSTAFSHVMPPPHNERPVDYPVAYAKDLALSPVALQRAMHKCRHVPLWIREMCAANEVVQDHGALPEVRDAVAIMEDGLVTFDAAAKKCWNDPKMRVGHWSNLTACDNPCGRGHRFRNATVSVRGIPCGTVTQKIRCRGYCRKPNLWAKCVSYGSGHVVTFDRAQYNYWGTGEYVLYQDLNTRERVDILSFRPNAKSNVVYTSGVAIRFGADTLAFQLLAPRYNVLKTTYNGAPIALKSGVSSTFGFMDAVSYTSASGRYIGVVKLLGGTTVTVVVGKFRTATGGFQQHLDAYIEVSGSKLGHTQGGCGVWDFNVGDDFASPRGGVKSNAQDALWTWRVDPTRSLFNFPVPIAYHHAKMTFPTNGAAPAAVAHAKHVCANLTDVFQDECVFDVIVAGTPTGRKSVMDVVRILDNHVFHADHNTVGCLLKAGSKLTTTTPWSKTCSKTCGGGFLSRHTNVVTRANHVCGRIIEEKPCNTQPCPINCRQTAWSTWSTCSNVCGNGHKTRFRTTVRKPEHGGKACGPLTEHRACHETHGCCNVSSWTPWGNCTNGMHSRTRKVNFKHCGHVMETRPCCELGPWSVWSSCKNGSTHRNRVIQGDKLTCSFFSRVETRPCCKISDFGGWSTCANGTQRRERFLEGDKKTCARWHRFETRACCQVSAWGSWSNCTDQGLRTRSRKLVGHCKGFAGVQSQPCCEVGAWGPWGTCTKGAHRRERKVAGDVKSCAHVARAQVRECCVVSSWSDWSACSGGKTTRTRNVTGAPSICKGHPSNQTKPCCKIGTWQAWGHCSNGTQTRLRSVEGHCTHSLPKETRPCCSASAWSVWSVCANGTQTRTRTTTGAPAQCKDVVKQQKRDCCSVGAWTGWSSCKNGSATRTRSVQGKDASCQHHKKHETRPCCHVHDWSDWSSECIKGEFTRTRKLEGDPTFCKKWSAKQTKPCCVVGVWGEWSKCKGGKHHRLRNVTGSKEHCGGIAPREERACCDIGPWSGWSPCKENKQHRQRKLIGDPSVCKFHTGHQEGACCSAGPWSAWTPCVNGQQARKRVVQGHEGCEDELPPEQFIKCEIMGCSPGKWSAWSQCANGTQSRSRVVYGPKSCLAKFPMAETRQCQKAAPIHMPKANATHGHVYGNHCNITAWSKWSKCSNGTVSRTRVLKGDCHVSVPHTEVRRCQCKLTAWSNWSTCVSGHHYRERSAVGACPSKPVLKESKPCSCKVSEWSVWSQCQANGTAYRVRTVTCDDLPAVEHRDCCYIGSFSEWGVCDDTGHQHRFRNVTNNARCRHLHAPKQSKQCCRVGKWSNFTQCDAKGFKRATRYVTPVARCTVLSPRSKVIDCCPTVGAWGPLSECQPDGFRHKYRNVTALPICHKLHPPVDSVPCCYVSNWTRWSTCEETNAWQIRTRNVTGNTPGCTHATRQKKDCCKVGAWGLWEHCEPITGIQLRHRSVSNYPRCLANYSTTQNKSCCVVANWSAWGHCTRDTLHHNRTRAVTPTPYCAARYPSTQTQECCRVGPWSKWADCAKHNAYTWRTRKVDGVPHCFLDHPQKQNHSCCKVSHWSAWSHCDRQSGMYKAIRNVSNYERCRREYPSVKTKECCAVDKWSNWTKCDGSGHSFRTRFVSPTKKCLTTHQRIQNKTCCLVGKWDAWSKCASEDGYERRTRSVTNASHCHKYHTEEKKSCCNPGHWSPWSKCDAKSGYQHRTRSVHASKRCQQLYKPKESQSCCIVGGWLPWSKCSEDGHRERKRHVAGHHSCHSMYGATDREHCCLLGDWGEYSKCGTNGTQVRKRIVKGWKTCAKAFKSEEHKPCCFVGKWGEYSKCNKGTAKRLRHVAGPASCIAKHAKSSTKDCCAAGPWSAWSPCINKKETRTREVYGPSKLNCTTQFVKKETRPCCHCGEWSKWSACSGVADTTASQSRFREVGQSNCHSSCPQRQSRSCPKASTSSQTGVTPLPASKTPKTPKAKTTSKKKEKEEKTPAKSSAKQSVVAHHPTSHDHSSIFHSKKKLVTPEYTVAASRFRDVSAYPKEEQTADEELPTNDDDHGLDQFAMAANLI